LSLPTRIGKFEILRRIGKGAMGEVFLGRDTVLGREVALKTILASSSFGEEARARFEREAQSTALLNHPNIVTVYEFGEEEGLHFLAMEYLAGEDLETLIQKRSLSRGESLELLAQVCEGLAYAHERGVIHRDVKPANILVVRHGKRLTAKLTDFGVALVNQSNLTQQGILMGTANYMAPEYLDTGKASASSDLFALGVMLYEVVSGGRKPFAGETTTLVLNAILRNPPAPFQPDELQGIDPRLVEVVLKTLAKRPEDRFPDAEALAQALRDVSAAAPQPGSTLPAGRPEHEKPLIVGKGGKATCLSLRVALRQAPPGGHITVLPGTYRETLVVDRDITIVGEGDPGAIILETALGSSLCLKAGQVHLQGLTLRKATQELEEGLPWLIVPSGRTTLEDCELIAPQGSAIAVEGAGTQLLLKRCHLQGEHAVGIEVDQGALVNLSHCLLEGHQRVGIRGRTGAMVTLLHTVLRDGEGLGLCLQSQSQAQLEDCEILGCRAGSLEVETEARATLRRCRLEGSDFAGVLAMEQGQANLEDCDIRDHQASGIHVTEGAIVSLHRSHLHHNPGFGVTITDQGLCTLSDCEIDTNAHPGVQVREKGTVQLKQCKLHDGQSLGIVCSAKGRGVLEGCEIYGNAQSGAKVERGGSLLLVACILRDGRDTGLLLLEDADLTLEECVVHRNARGGILLAKDASDPVLRGGNRIEDDLLRTTDQGGVVKLAPVKRH